MKRYNKVDYIIHEKFYANLVTMKQFRFMGSSPVRVIIPAGDYMSNHTLKCT